MAAAVESHIGQEPNRSVWPAAQMEQEVSSYGEMAVATNQMHCHALFEAFPPRCWCDPFFAWLGSATIPPLRLSFPWWATCELGELVLREWGVSSLCCSCNTSCRRDVEVNWFQQARLELFGDHCTGFCFFFLPRVVADVPCYSISRPGSSVLFWIVEYRCFFFLPLKLHCIDICRFLFYTPTISKLPLWFFLCLSSGWGTLSSWPLMLQQENYLQNYNIQIEFHGIIEQNFSTIQHFGITGSTRTRVANDQLSN